MLKRRSFLAYFSIGWLTSCFPMILAICDPRKAIAQADIPSTGDKDRAKPVAQKKSEGFTVVGSVSDLDKNGYLQTKEVAVLRSPGNPDKLIAVNPKCTHQGCAGEVLNGPATKPLTAYSAKIVGTQVLVAISAPSATPNPTPSGRGQKN
jgi:cytochrome b6-f complex iron-sulfur subunit